MLKSAHFSYACIERRPLREIPLEFRNAVGVQKTTSDGFFGWCRRCDDTTFTLALTQFQYWTERMTDKQADINANAIATSHCVC